MNREIKFRGKCSHCDAWAYGNLVDYGEDEAPEIHGFDPFREDEERWREITVDRETVGQYTGLHDKKGNEIYEGDIIFAEFADKSGGYNLVGWNGEAVSWGIMDAYSYQSLKEGHDFAEFKNYVLLAFLKKAIVCEVVGNIHDNPKLISEPEL